MKIWILFSVMVVSTADLTDLASPVVQGIGTIISSVDGAINSVQSLGDDTPDLLGSGIEVRYGPGTIKDEIESIPQDVVTAIERGWLPTPRPPGPPEYAALNMYCYKDYVICALYLLDKIAGMQVAFLISKIASASLDLPTQGYVKWDVETEPGVVMSFYATQQYFISPESAKSGNIQAEEVVPINDSDKILKQGAVWVTGFNGELFNISTQTSVIKESLFTRQACQVGKGIHYLYNLTKTGPEPCKADNILHWFPIIHKRQMVATGLFLLGKVNTTEGQRDWYERPPGIGLRLLIPNAPQCLYELADQGVVSTHIYYVQNINLLLCPLGLV